MKLITEVSPEQKKVLVRADLDVPVQDGKIVEDFRLRALFPTLEYLLQKKAQTVLIGHLDRPGGKIRQELSLKPVALKLEELGLLVHFNNIYYYKQSLKSSLRSNFSELKQRVSELTKEGKQILLLENLRFHSEEEENDDLFARGLASLADFFVNEAFADSHREHASIVGIPKYLPSFAGIQFAKEIKTLAKIKTEPLRPLLFILAGAKTETKIPLVKKFAKLADTILLAGKLMFAQELEGVPHTRFPVDAVRIDDIGPRSIELFLQYIKEARTIVWNGPLGRFEKEEYARGTQEIAKALFESQAEVVIGGGETIAALDKFGLLKQKVEGKFISTGGGAMLEFLADGTLPGIEALNQSQSAIR